MNYMKSILLIGYKGYVAKNIFDQFSNSFNFYFWGRENSYDELITLINQSDYVVHTASKQKLSVSEESFEENYTLTDFIVRNIGSKKLFYFSSIHSSTNSLFGITKKREEDLVITKLKNYQIFILPHTFGKFGRPDYNSVFNTFLINYVKESTVNVDLKKKKFNVFPIDNLYKYFNFDDGAFITRDFKTYSKTLIAFLTDIELCFNFNTCYYKSIQNSISYYEKQL